MADLFTWVGRAAHGGHAPRRCRDGYPIPDVGRTTVHVGTSRVGASVPQTLLFRRILKFNHSTLARQGHGLARTGTHTGSPIIEKKLRPMALSVRWSMRG